MAMTINCLNGHVHRHTIFIAGCGEENQYCGYVSAEPVNTFFQQHVLQHI